MSDARPVLLGEMSWPEIAELAEQTDLAVLPVGAVEQHGPHLPLLVDAIQVEAIAHEASRRCGVPVAPTFTYSSSQGHSRLFPGTMALSPGTTVTALAELCDWLYSAGFRKLFILNGHVGNGGPIWNALDVAQGRLPRDVSLHAMSWWDLTPELWKLVTSDCPEADWLFHANWGETSLMLHLRPDLVRLDRAVDEDDKPWLFTYDMAKLSQTGAIGRRTTEATADGGREIFELAVSALADRIERMRAEEHPEQWPADVRAWRRQAAERYLRPRD
jgi:creatinine amidohydrolase